MATASSSEVRNASATWRSHDLATMHATGAPAPIRLARTSSFSALTPARRVEPNATNVAVSSVSFFFGPREELDVLGIGTRPATLDEADPQVVELLGHAQLVVDGERQALLLTAVPEDGVEDVHGLEEGRATMKSSRMRAVRLVRRACGAPPWLWV